MDFKISPEFLRQVAQQNLDTHGVDDPTAAAELGLMLPEDVATLEIAQPAKIFNPLTGVEKAAQDLPAAGRKIRGRKRPLTRAQATARDHEVRAQRLRLDISEPPSTVQ